jgi:hypothetical protein
MPKLSKWPRPHSVPFLFRAMMFSPPARASTQSWSVPTCFGSSSKVFHAHKVPFERTPAALGFMIDTCTQSRFVPTRRGSKMSVDGPIGQPIARASRLAK